MSGAETAGAEMSGAEMSHHLLYSFQLKLFEFFSPKPLRRSLYRIATWNRGSQADLLEKCEVRRHRRSDLRIPGLSSSPLLRTSYVNEAEIISLRQQPIGSRRARVREISVISVWRLARKATPPSTRQRVFTTMCPRLRRPLEKDRSGLSAFEGLY